MVAPSVSTSNTFGEEETNKNAKKIENLKALKNECGLIIDKLLAGKLNLAPLKQIADNFTFDTQYFINQIERMEKALNEGDLELAIGTAKELIETCCKTILCEKNSSLEDTSPTIQTLTKETIKKLNLAPEDIDGKNKGSETIKRILQNLGCIPNNIAELRGLYGTGHGKNSKSRGLSERHARLAVGTASTFVKFLYDTHLETKI